MKIFKSYRFWATVIITLILAIAYLASRPAQTEIGDEIGAGAVEVVQ